MKFTSLTFLFSFLYYFFFILSLYPIKARVPLFVSTVHLPSSLHFLTLVWFISQQAFSVSLSWCILERLDCHRPLIGHNIRVFSLTLQYFDVTVHVWISIFFSILLTKLLYVLVLALLLLFVLGSRLLLVILFTSLPYFWSAMDDDQRDFFDRLSIGSLPMTLGTLCGKYPTSHHSCKTHTTLVCC